MKNLREEELFDELERRLRNYTEDPDDSSWDKIAGALPKGSGNNAWIWFDRVSNTTVIILLLFLLTTILTTNQGDSKIADKQSVFVLKDSSSTTDKFSETADGELLTPDKRIVNSIQPIEQKVKTRPKRNHEDDLFKGNAMDVDINKSESIVRPVKSSKRQDATSSKTGEVIGDTENRNLLALEGGMSSTDKNLLEVGMNHNIEIDVKKIDKLPEGNDDITSEHQNRVIVVSSVNQADSLQRKIVEMSKRIDDVDTKQIGKPGEEAAIVPIKELLKSGIDANDDGDKKKKLPKELKPRKKHFKSGVYFNITPSLAYYKIKPNRDDEFTITGLKATSIFNSNRLGISMEAGFQRQLTERFEVYGGISYYTQHQRIVYYALANNDATLESKKGDFEYSITPANAEEHSINYSMKNLGISGGAFYRIKDGMLQHKIGVGLQYQKGLGANDGITYDNGSANYLNYLLAYRLELIYTQRLSLYLQPNINHVIRSNEQLKQPLNVKPYRAGISFGVNYRF